MPDQNGGGNQSGGPINPFQPKTTQGGNGNTVPKPETREVKPVNPFQPKATQGGGGNTVPKPESSPKPETREVQPVNPFAANLPPKPESSPKPESLPKPTTPLVEVIEPSKTASVNPFSSVRKEAPKKVPTPKFEETPKETPAPKSAKAPKVEPAVAVKVVESVEPVDEFKHQMMDILDQAGITKGTLIKTVVVIGIAVLMIMGYVYGWYEMIAGKFNSGIVQTEPQKQEEITKSPIVTNEVEVSSPSSAFSLISAYIFGLEFSGANTPIQAVPMGTWGSDAGIRAANIFGMILDENKVKFIEYVALLRQLQNIYDTDIYALLDMSVDRRAALQEHINDLVYLLDKAGVAYSDLDAQLALFDQQYAPIISGKDINEANFFNSLYAYYGDQAYVNLGMFIKSSQDAVTMKAYFNAYKTLRDLLATYINSLRIRYSDISANTEALIKGVRVFYVPNSDIKTIIKLGE